MCSIMSLDLSQYAGNAEQYDIKHVKRVKSSLENKTILFLGSSVTLGACSFHQSFADYLAAKDGIIAIKEAVNGTTLAVRDDGASYVERLLKCKTPPLDGFVCQLSTNDARKGAKLGNISKSINPADFDIHTTIGAMEYIIAYVKKEYKCPIIFYTGTRFDNAQYEKMVNALYQLKKKWGIVILDLWHNEKMNQVSKEDYALYMHDPVHPTKAGYLLWWLPRFEACLKQVLK